VQIPPPLNKQTKGYGKKTPSEKLITSKRGWGGVAQCAVLSRTCVQTPVLPKKENIKSLGL
jgi:hypothetical protein